MHFTCVRECVRTSLAALVLTSHVVHEAVGVDEVGL